MSESEIFKSTVAWKELKEFQELKKKYIIGLWAEAKALEEALDEAIEEACIYDKSIIEAKEEVLGE